MYFLRFIIFIYFLSCSFLSYSQSAFSNLAATYADSGNYEEAIRLEKLNLELLETTNNYGELYASSLCNLGRYYHYMGQTHESIHLLNDAIIRLQQEETFDSKPYLYVFQDLGGYNFMMQNYSASIRYSLIALEISELTNSSDSVEETLLLDNIALAYYHLDDYKKALIYGERAIKCMSSLDDVESQEILSLLTNYSLYLKGDNQLSKAQEIIESTLNYANTQNIAKSNKKYQRALTIGIELYEESKNITRIRELSNIYYSSIQNDAINMSIDLLENIHRVAYVNYSNGNYNEAIRFKEIIRDYYISSNQKYTEDFANVLNDLSVYYMNISNFDVALNYVKEVLEIREQLLGKRNALYIDALDNYALIYDKLNKYNEAIKIGDEILELADDVVESNSIKYVAYLHNQANRYLELGDLKNALALEYQAYEICLSHIDHPYYLISVNGLITMYGRLGLYNEAQNLGKDILDKYKNGNIQVGNDNYLYFRNFASLFLNSGDYETALALSSDINDFIITQWGKSHKNYINSIDVFASSLVNTGRKNEALTIVEDLMQTYKNGENVEDFIQALDIAARIYYIADDKQGCYGIMNDWLSIIKQQYGDNDTHYILAQIQYIKYLGNDWLNNGNAYKLSSLLTDEFLKAVKNVLPFSEDYELLLRLKCMLCFSDRNFEELMKYVSECNEVSIKKLQNNAYLLTNNEMKQFWQETNGWFKEEINIYASKCCNYEISKEAYNALLFSKGMLLNSEIELDKYIIYIGSENILKNYSEIKSIRNDLNKIYEKPSSERSVDIDSLEMRVNDLERLVKLELMQYGDYTHNLSITWQDVRNNLKQNDAAIEFVSFPLNNDSTMYMAYVLRHDMDAPALVKLFEEKQISSLSDDELYKKTKGSEMIWTKLKSELNGVDNVYFAPDGMLHQIGIESFPDFDNPEKNISDRFNLYRLSSTRQLAVKNQAVTSDNAVVYGGIQYDISPDVMVAESRKYDIPSSKGIQSWYNVADSISIRSGLDFLKFTLKEATSVSDLLQNAHKPYQLISGNEATEESFKNLSGNKNGILHIATHGFYWEKDEADYRADVNERLLFMSQFGDNAKRNIEDKALTRTGLFMAGANNVLTGKDIPDGVDDGILTAQEITNLDFRGLDLVVLSACQTGMGDISCDGVFGLQRGFKKAGANSIFMSLWDVNDKATQILMTEFYKNYLNGRSKRESLLAAQKAVRETSGFEDPEYWAAFILLDALN